MNAISVICSINYFKNFLCVMRHTFEKSVYVSVLTCLALVLFGCKNCNAAKNAVFNPQNEDKVFRIGGVVQEMPLWAKEELAAFAAMEECYQDFIRRYVLPDGATVVTANCNHGNIDDILEGIFQWDKFVLLAGSDDLRNKFIRIWKYHWRYGCEKDFFRDGFYWKGYDAEHAGELLPMLWACLELSPNDKELIDTNISIVKVLMSEKWFHPTHHLFRYSIIATFPTDNPAQRERFEKWRGECGINTVYCSGPWLAWLTTGREQYRQWVLNYASAWNRLAKSNNGVFPYHVDTESLKLGPYGDGRWWKGTSGGTEHFDYAASPGLSTSIRGFRNLPVAAVFADKGNLQHSEGLLSTTKAIYFASATTNGLSTSTCENDNGNLKRGRWSHDDPVLLDKAYVLTWEASLAHIMANYPKEKTSWLERELIDWFNFTYNRIGDLKLFEEAMKRAQHRARRSMEKAAALKNPLKGDDLSEVTLNKPWDLDYIDGAQWAGQNGRNGGPSPGSIGYFDVGGRRGLPPGIAAVVKHIASDEMEVILYNSNQYPARIAISGGYYGQHLITTITEKNKSFMVNSPIATLELPQNGCSELSIRLKRYEFTPTLTPVERCGK